MEVRANKRRARTRGVAIFLANVSAIQAGY
jgi:hypothetical protein